MWILCQALAEQPALPPPAVEDTAADTGGWKAEPPAPIVPTPPRPGGGLPLALAAGGASAVLAASGAAARSARKDLEPTGWLPTLLQGVEVGARGAALVALFAAALWLLPTSTRWALPWALGAFALAVGWSARDVLPDWVAWSFLAAEGHLRPGTWVRGDGFEGIVRALRPRVLWVVDDRGRLAAVPNRLVLRSVLHWDPAGHPEVIVSVDLPNVPADEARSAVAEAAWLSPWLAPGTSVRTTSDPEVAGRWTVCLRIVDLSCRDRFVGTFRERVFESLGHGASPDGLPAL